MNLWIVVTQVEITVVLTLLQDKEGLGSNLMCVPALYHVKRVNKETSCNTTFIRKPPASCKSVTEDLINSLKLSWGYLQIT